MLIDSGNTKTNMQGVSMRQDGIVELSKQHRFLAELANLVDEKRKYY